MPRAPSSTKAGSRGGARGGGVKSSGAGMRHDPLGVQMHADEMTSRFGTVSAPGRRSKAHRRADDEEAGADAVPSSGPSTMRVTGAKAGQFVDPKLSRNILRLAREQQEEIEAEEVEEAHNGMRGIKERSKITFEDADSDTVPSRALADEGELDSDEEEREELEYDDDAYGQLEIDPEDAALMNKFGNEEGNNVGPNGNKTLADIIMEKIEAAERQQQRAAGGLQATGDRGEMPMPPGINPKVIEVYTKVGELLSRYKSGPLPKAFKIIPTLPAWENILYITGPSTWTPHATLAATRIFVSNLKSQQTQKFFELVLLDKIREEIGATGKASYQLYEAIKKALYKPAAFFKGVLFPICQAGCTLKEAAIIASVLTRVSIPILHSAAALLHLAEMHYAGPTSLFIRVLLDKKYALPYKVVDALVFHFLRFSDPAMGVERVEGGGRRMPVLWHQSLLVFAQRYKQDLTPDQKAALIDLLRVQWHDGISPDVRRELNSGKARGEMLDEPIDEDDDDIMSI